MLLMLMSASAIITLPIFNTTNASAAPNDPIPTHNRYESLTPAEQIQSHLYLYALTYCMKNSDLSGSSVLSGFSPYRSISSDDAQDGHWWFDNGGWNVSGGGTSAKTYVGPYMNGSGIAGIKNNGEVNCSEPSLVMGAMALWNLDTEITTVLCNSGFEREHLNNNQTVAQCIADNDGQNDGQGNDAFEVDNVLNNKKDQVAKKFFDYIKAQVTDPGLTIAQKYIYYRHTLNESCIPGIDTTPPDKTGGLFYTKAEWVDVDSMQILQTDINKSFYQGKMLRGEMVKLGITTGIAQDNKPCSYIFGEMNKLATDFLIWAKQHPDEARALAKDINPPTNPDNNGTTCAITGIGWIICPVVNFMAGIADSAYNFLETNFLSVKVQMFDTGNPTYSAWSIMRSFANVAFVIAFLIIIFSQLTGFGIANYGIKKLLPRIIIAAILVNLSYFICQLGVDLSNILGKSMSDLFLGLPAGGNQTPGFWSAGVGGGHGTWSFIAGGILAGAVAGTAAWVALPALIPVLIAAVVALVMVLFILVARQAIIVLLVVIAPLAFVAYLLPNTENLFTKWRKLLTSMLLLYPIVALIYGVSTFASKILNSAMSSMGLIGQIAAASVVVLPLFLIPSLLKKSMDGVGNIGKTLNNLGSRAGKGAGKLGSTVYDRSTLGQYKKYRASEAEKRRAKIQSGTYEGKRGRLNVRNWRSAGHKKFNDWGRTGEFGTRRSAQGEAMVAEAEAKDVAQAQTLLEAKIARSETTSGEEFTAAVKSGDTVGAKAALNIQFQTASGRTKSHQLLKDAETNGGVEFTRSLKRHVASTQPDMDNKDAALGDWSHNASTTDEDRPFQLNDIEKHANTYKITDGKMAGQTVAGMLAASDSGVLTKDVADRILTTENLAAGLKPNERALLEHLHTHGTLAANGTTPAYTPPQNARF